MMYSTNGGSIQPKIANSGLHNVSRPKARTLVAIRYIQITVTMKMAIVASPVTSWTALTGPIALRNSSSLSSPSRNLRASSATAAVRIVVSTVAIAAMTVRATMASDNPRTRRRAARGVGDDP